MNQALPVNAAANLATEEQLSNWVTKFTSYRHSPTRERLLEWLARFDPAHLPVAHKVLDSVRLVSELEIQQGYRGQLDSLPGWSRSAAKRTGRWFFVGAGSAGESGPAMLRLFREANGLENAAWQSFFVTVKELPGLSLSACDSLVFVDDFAGTGTQLSTYWNDFLQELIASEAKCYLLLTAITDYAQRRIASETDLKVIASIVLEEKDNLFSEKCPIFSEDERALLEDYGKLASRKFPRGFGDCGLAFVLSHKTPNNSLPILYANHANWIGPFPRNLLQTQPE